MRVFLSASIRGGRQMLSTYMEMCNYLQDSGHEVLSWHVADPELEKTESLLSEEDIYIRDMQFLEKSECMIAEVSTPSIGVGYEICSALQREIPVLCLNVPEANVSAMLLGDKRIICKDYHDIDEMKEFITKFLNDANKH
ncbi:deoxyribonucleoside 5'-monophosphate N-glycosidase [Methanolobus vulcani]|uniref:Putative 2'-deoxynucleoside 5'-phosphate N-hydrolase 1 n=1 Tax=Methanolobus vulcani TaxID=38026 RepID=A0A7Z8KQN4_9EURY|nr:deoxyribonucleoside 5'-monophosphate N-glycosidase [Methanolobus vulcani]TQD28325.1 deoxyribonucleoside 5'-monophosphate N-glycosidase [Methanolobus vulcani]